MDAVGSELQDPDRPSAHPVTPPAEDDGVDLPRQDPPQQYLSLLPMESPADNEVHQARRLYLEFADKTKERQLRTCETPSGGLDLVDLRGEYEVVLGQPARRVRPKLDPERPVGEVEVGVVSLLFGDGGDPVDQLDPGHEALETEGLGQLEVALGLDHDPPGQLLEESVDLGRRKGGRAGVADDAMPFRQRR